MYAYFYDISIKIHLYAQNVHPKIHLDVVIREGDSVTVETIIIILNCCNTFRFIFGASSLKKSMKKQLTFASATTNHKLLGKLQMS